MFNFARTIVYYTLVLCYLRGKGIRVVKVATSHQAITRARKKPKSLRSRGCW